MDPREKLIVAADVPNLDALKRLTGALFGHVRYYKIGLELITACGPEALEHIGALGGRVFYDGKFHDIPNTVAAAVRRLRESKLGNIMMCNLHASAGPEAIQAAVRERGNILVLGVTVLTSMNEDTCRSIYGSDPRAKVLEFANSLYENGAQGLVCSGQELDALNTVDDFQELLKVVPGVRPASASVNDQKRVVTPAAAIKGGADYLVVGRPITAPDSGTPTDAANRILDEIASAM